MSSELFWLTLTVGMTVLFWIPYILDRIQRRGFRKAMDNPGPNDPPQSAWAERQMRAHTNAVESLVTFAPLVLIVDSIDASNVVTVGACIVYFWARLAHYIVYTLGIPIARTIAFAVGWAAQIALLVALLTVA